MARINVVSIVLIWDDIFRSWVNIYKESFFPSRKRCLLIQDGYYLFNIVKVICTVTTISQRKTYLLRPPPSPSLSLSRSGVHNESTVFSRLLLKQGSFYVNKYTSLARSLTHSLTFSLSQVIDYFSNIRYSVIEYDLMNT